MKKLLFALLFLLPTSAAAAQYDTAFPDVLNCGVHDSSLSATTSVLFYYSTKDDSAGSWWGSGANARQYESLTGFGVMYLIYDSEGNFVSWSPTGNADYTDCQGLVSDLNGYSFGNDTSSGVVNNPTLDWFLGFLIFFICMMFPIWLFRRQ